MAGPVAGVHGPPHRLARRPPGAGPRHAPPRRVAGADGDLRRRLRRDGLATTSCPSRRGRSCAGRSSASPRPASCRRSPASSSSRSIAARTTRAASNGYETLPPHDARARRLHDPGGRPARGLLRRRPRVARGLEPRPVDQPGRVGPGPVGDQPRVPARARDGRPAHPVQARDARPGRGGRDGRDVHGQAVRGHDRVLVPPAPVARRRRGRERVPRRGRPRTASRPRSGRRSAACSPARRS